MSTGGSRESNSQPENALLAALGNPLRRRILRRMRDEEMISPRQLASEFGLPLSNLAYHVRVLARCEAITLVKVKPVRGAVKHFYRSTVEPPWARQIVDLEPLEPHGHAIPPARGHG
ncbi:MAG: Helix-turn-helix domain [Solirubrobacterales bacterium]|jgi:DNA-binding transcriptional ArsR family regulator|nr:Helix-turn-helix domain [Solirubrobacterales bacterium]